MFSRDLKNNYSKSFRLNSQDWAGGVDSDSDLLSVAVTVQPKSFFKRRHLGRALQAQVLRAISWSDKALADSIHQHSGPTPFTVSDVVEIDEGLVFRISALNLSVAAAISRALGNRDEDFEANPHAPYPPLAVGATLDLDRVPFKVTGTATRAGAHPLAGQISYTQLALPWVYQQSSPSNQLVFEFICPTLFKSNGLDQMVPLPEWVFGSLADRWNAFAPIGIPADKVREVARSEWQMVDLDLRSVAVPFKKRTTKLGSIGKVTYRAPRLHVDDLYPFNLLAEFAFFSGVGRQTTMGFGFCLTYPT